MVTVKRTNSENLDFQKLVQELDIDLGVYYKDEKVFYGELNAIDKIKHTVVAFNENNVPVGCGGIKAYSKYEMEIKRMFVLCNYRGKGVAAIVLKELEKWSSELHFKACILETLKEKSYAIKFYQKHGYKAIPNFGDYIDAKNSICFKKELE